MPILQVGRNHFTNLAGGFSTCCWGATGAVIVVGCNTGAHVTGSTFLLMTNANTSGYPRMVTMDATYPQLNTCNSINFRATFSTCSACWDWREWGIYTATASGTDGHLMNRMLEDPSLGTKTSAQSWQFTATITITS